MLAPRSPIPWRWCSPETLASGGRNTSAASDVWSLGVTMWEMVSGGRNVPFQFCKSPKDLLKVCVFPFWSWTLRSKVTHKHLMIVHLPILKSTGMTRFGLSCVSVYMFVSLFYYSSVVLLSLFPQSFSLNSLLCQKRDIFSIKEKVCIKNLLWE